MNYQLKNLIFILLAGLLLFTAGLQEAEAIGTTALEDIINALETDTTPLAAGELSVKWVNRQGADTTYASTVPISTSVDTGYDMTGLGDTLAPGITQNANPGDSIVYAIPIENLGNYASAEPFDFSHKLKSDSSVGNDTFDMELWLADGEQDANYDFTADTELTPAGDQALFAEHEVKTLFAVVSVADTAVDGDSVDHDFFATNNAPVYTPSSTGDAWERGKPLGGDDQYDTQYLYFTTTVKGPDLSITKSLSVNTVSASGDPRPGDTVTYTIVATNNGGDTAHDVDIVDAIPEFTTYVPNSAQITDSGGNSTGTIDFADSLGDETFGYSNDDEGAVKILWPINEIGPDTQTNNSVTVEFKVTID